MESIENDKFGPLYIYIICMGHMKHIYIYIYSYCIIQFLQRNEEIIHFEWYRFDRLDKGSFSTSQ